MGLNSGIVWTGATWNFVVGCSICSSGCKACYAQKQALRNARMGIRHYAGLVDSQTGVWTGEVRLAPRHIMEAPLRRQKPTRWFVNSMSDWLHPGVQPEWIGLAMDICEATPQHTYQWLTKRPQRMVEVLDQIGRRRVPVNCWMGVTVEGECQDLETQRPVRDRIDMLRQNCEAQIKWISFEPLISDLPHLDLRDIDWAIIGGESNGLRARPMKLEWARSIRDQCKSQGAALFMKQWGTARGANPDLNDPTRSTSKGGRMLDGHLWDEYPVSSC